MGLAFYSDAKKRKIFSISDHARSFHILTNSPLTVQEVASCASKKEFPLIQWGNFSKAMIFLVNESTFYTVGLNKDAKNEKGKRNFLSIYRAKN